MTYQPPVREHLFLLRDVLKIERHANLPGFSDASLDVVEQILGESARFCTEVLAPLNAVGDKQGCTWNADGSVTTPPGFKDAYRAFVEGGWPALGADPEWGGQGLPSVINLPVSEMNSSANMAFSMYPGLTHGAYTAIHAGGSDAQKALYLPKLASGQWCGTMNLTEPQCGTDLGLIRTKAAPARDGTHRIWGQKIFISSGEHDLAENIVHLVLARVEGAPAGTRGISLFVVPKFLPDAQGNPGARNAVRCLSIEEKMGIHGSSTCVMSYEDATGWLVGEENRGLQLMFVMMNEERLAVGMQGLSLGEAAYQAAAAYAKERLQGRSLTGPKNAAGGADPIVVHPDVRRMLMDSRSVLEAGRALILWTALHGDLARRAMDEEAKRRGDDMMALLTPVLKAFLTERGFLIASEAMQVHGGAGFTEHFPVSQYLRDSRITLIYEGTNGVQAMDLVGRKLPAAGGRAVMGFLGDIDAYVAGRSAADSLKPFLKGLADTKAQLQEATLWLMQNGVANPENAGAGALDYLRLFGLTGLAYMWALMAEAALARIADGDADPFYANKLTVGRYFLDRVLPDAGAALAKLKSGAEWVMALPAEAF